MSLAKKFFLLIFSIFHLSTYSQNSTLKNYSVEYLIKSETKLIINTSYELEVINKNCLKNTIFYAQIDKYKDLSKLKYEIFNSSGERVSKYSKDDAINLSLNSSNEITDSRTIILQPKYANYPFRIVVNYTEIYNGFLSIPAWFPQPYKNVDVINSNLTVEHPLDYNLRIKELKVNAKSRVEKGKKIYNFNVDRLNKKGDEINSENFYLSQPKVLLAPENFSYASVKGNMATWKGFGNWFLRINSNRNELLPETKKNIDNLKMKYSGKELLAEIYEYMQDRTRYVSIQFGIGGYQCQKSIEVDEKGYGDCKALTNYMKSMLDYAEIKSNYVLVHAGDNVVEVDKDFPSNQFNHVILGVPFQKDTIFLECTSQRIPFGYLGSFTDDRNVLWIEKDMSKIVRSPLYDEKRNRLTTKGAILIKNNGDAIMDFNIQTEGLFFDKEFALYEQLNTDQQEQYKYVMFDYKDFLIKRFNISQESRRKDKQEKNVNLEVKNFGKNISGNLIFKSNTLPSINTYLKLNKYQKHIEIKRGFNIVDEVIISFEKENLLLKSPNNIFIENQYGSFAFRFKKDENKLIVKRDYKFHKGKYMNDEFDEFHSLIKELEAIENKKILAKSNT